MSIPTARALGTCLGAPTIYRISCCPLVYSEPLLLAQTVETYVHAKDTGLVQLVDDLFGRYAHGTYEQLGLLLDDHVDELVETALSVIVVCLSGITADGGNEQIDAERQIGRGQRGFQLANGAAQVLGSTVSALIENTTWRMVVIIEQ
jgi:hypothetical protein